MSKAKFAAAKELIDEKKYDEARAILRTLDHPAARDWEAKLDKIDPPFQPPQTIIPAQMKPVKKPNPSGLRNIIIVTISIFLAIELFRAVSNSGSQPEPTKDATSVAMLYSTATAAQISENSTATVVALTPSATITDTPIPSETPVPSSTPLPPTAELGTKGNPYPSQEEGAVRDGRFRVNRLLINQTENVKKQNMFNDDPPAGGEYVIAFVTFFCDLPSDKTCNVSAMDFDLVGKKGTVYNIKRFTTLHNPFQGEVFGGGETSGDIAFVVNSDDGSYVVAVNDLGDRTFFAANQIN